MRTQATSETLLVMYSLPSQTIYGHVCGLTSETLLVMYSLPSQTLYGHVCGLKLIVRLF